MCRPCSLQMVNLCCGSYIHELKQIYFTPKSKLQTSLPLIELKLKEKKYKLLPKNHITNRPYCPLSHLFGVQRDQMSGL